VLSFSMITTRPTGAVVFDERLHLSGDVSRSRADRLVAAAEALLETGEEPPTLSRDLPLLQGTEEAPEAEPVAAEVA
jgi:hypothetical protein